MANQDLYFSSYNEGATPDFWLEVYNPTDAPISLNDYALGQVLNVPATPGTYQFWRTFTQDATIPARGHWVMARDSADEQDILTHRDQILESYLTTGNDGLKLLKKVQGSNNFQDGAIEGQDFTVLDCLGDWNNGTGAPWYVAGEEHATFNQTLVRKTSVQSGNTDWTAAAGTNTADSEWIVMDVNSFGQLKIFPGLYLQK